MSGVLARHLLDFLWSELHRWVSWPSTHRPLGESRSIGPGAETSTASSSVFPRIDSKALPRGLHRFSDRRSSIAKLAQDQPEFTVTTPLASPLCSPPTRRPRSKNPFLSSHHICSNCHLRPPKSPLPHDFFQRLLQLPATRQLVMTPKARESLLATNFAGTIVYNPPTASRGGESSRLRQSFFGISVEVCW